MVYNCQNLTRLAKQMINDYLKLNWRLVQLAPNTKEPPDTNWNKADFAPNITHEQVGIAHAFSGTCALDIDDYQQTYYEFQALGIDLAKMVEDNVGIVSGVENRYKLLFKLETPLRTKFIKDSKNSIIYELRSGTACGQKSTQDVLPPSIHPDTGKPYVWAGDYNNLQPLPEPLKKHWQNLIARNLKKSNDVKVNISWANVKQALDFIPADVNYHDWILIGMALFYADWHSPEKRGLQLFGRWSKTGAKFKGDYEVSQKWKSFAINDIKIGTLFYIATQYGWTKQQNNVQGLFKNVTNVSQRISKNQMGDFNPLFTKTEVMDIISPKAPDLNLDHLPSIIKSVAVELSNTIGADPLTSVLACLSAVSGAADASTRLKLAEGFTVPPLLWCMTVGDPADKKTPASKPIFSVFDKMKNEDRDRYQTELLLWEGKEATYNANKKDYLLACQDPLNQLPNDVASKLPEPLATKPQPLRITVKDITSQKLVRVCEHRPKGLLLYLDEMAGWVNKITDSKSGDDRSSWTVAYESSSYEMDRVGDGAIYCSNYALSIYGNMQPSVLKRVIFQLEEDGLLQRFIPAVLRSEYDRVGEPLTEPSVIMPEWEDTIRQVFSLPKSEYELCPQSYSLFREFQHWHADFKKQERLTGYDNLFLRAIGKLEGLVGRLCLVFHITETPYTMQIQEATMIKTLAFVKSYVISSYRFCYSENSKSNHSLGMWLLNYCIAKSKRGYKSTTIKDIRGNCKRLVNGWTISSEPKINYIITEEVEQLVRFGWLSEQSKGGNKRYVFNPNLCNF